MRSWIPNSITMGNLLMGCLAIVFSTSSEPDHYLLGMTCVVIAGLLDFLDGLVARALGVSSALGAQLDSLADVVTFGVVPGLWASSLLPEDSGLRFIPFIIAIGAAYRLGRFNLDTEAAAHFKGLPVPASAMIWVAAMGLHLQWMDDTGAGLPHEVIYALSLITTLLMVSTVPLLNLKFKGLKWEGQSIKWILLMVCIFTFAVMGLLGKSVYISILLSVAIYLMLSLVHYKKLSS
jgi:CDP-diacylglycerol--serine O-phosphatidyltransferase